MRLPMAYAIVVAAVSVWLDDRPLKYLRLLQTTLPLATNVYQNPHDGAQKRWCASSDI